MSDKEIAATQLGAAGEDVETAVSIAKNEPSARELEIERIAARTAAVDHGVTEQEPVAAPAAEVVAAAPDLTTQAQLGQQLEDGRLVLDEATLERAFVRTKVDGKEEFVPATKALGQFQKNSAADVRLAEATRMSKEATETLAAAQAELARARTPAEKARAAEEVAAASADAQSVMQDFSTALFEGDTEKASKLFGDAVKAAMPANPAPAVDLAQLTDQAAAAVKQRLSVDSALDQLLTAYPEIAKDSDLVLIADTKRAGYIAQGKNPAEAILLAGEDVGKKYGLGKYAKGAEGGSGPTTREEKLAAKQKLEYEPQATSARAATHTPTPQTNSDIIAEMAKGRGQRLP